jgi:hypothetical protein
MRLIKKPACTNSDPPDVFFRTFIEGVQPGRMLLPAGGQESNAVLATSLGWDVNVFDFCLDTRKKALETALTEGIKAVNYTGYIEFHELEEEMYDVIALIHVYLELQIRSFVNRKLISSLKSGGFFLIEACSGQQADSGGEKPDPPLYDIAGIKEEFNCLDIETLYQIKAGGDEGSCKGQGSLVRMVAVKP